ncbi:mitochondrial genome maintenance MGM101-domain-containing protein [Pilobolus umbonatus]|nr:mitochondrial genome maintenance MGM101-domain-containing protein [Pilobolus umbonatus]
MQVNPVFRRICRSFVQWNRNVTTSQYVKVLKKDTTFNKPKIDFPAKDTNIVKEAKVELGAIAPVATELHFPMSQQFDTSSEDITTDDSHNWSNSFFGLSTKPFPKEVSDILLEPINAEDIEVKPDGLIYLPEIKYRRILNKAFGPGGWGLAPRGEHTISAKNISREYALVCNGRFVSQARGEQDFFDVSGLPTASEGCKSNALMRCCKDLGIASELWDPVFIRKFKKKYCTEVWAEHVTTKKKKKVWRKKDDVLDYPYKEA